MELSAHILSIAALAFFTALAARYFTHMFQLNSYTAKVQFAWYKENFAKLIPCIILFIISFGCSYLSYREHSYAHLVFALSASVLALFYTPKKEKKPIVYTARVKRLLTTFALLCIILIAVSVIVGGSIGVILSGCAALLIPLFIIIANILNAPI